MYHVIKEIVLLRKLLEDMGAEQEVPTPLFSDNEAAIGMANNPILNGLNKHMKIMLHWVRQMVKEGIPGGAEPERVGSGGAEPAGAGTGGVESGGAERVESGGAEPELVEPGGAASWGAEPACAESGGSPGVPLRREPLSPQRLLKWYA
ncbi:unnamed protein product [Closterium sp. NIES-54]